MHDVVILGATGASGRLVVERALAHGHKVTAVVRSADHPPFGSEVEVRQADVTDPQSLLAAVSGAATVIGTLGANRGPLMQQSTAALVRAAAAGGPHRVVMLSGYSVLTDRLTRPAGLMATTAMKAMSTDKAAAESLLRASDTDWTVVYATRLTNAAATGRTRVLADGERIGLRASITRADVAEFLVQAVDDPAMSRRDVVIAG